MRGGRALWTLLPLALLACAGPAQAALRHEVLEAPVGLAAPETALPLRIRFEADCTSLVARLRGPEPGVPMALAAAADAGLEVAGPDGARFDASPCLSAAAQTVSVEVVYAIAVRRDAAAFAALGVGLDAALEPVEGDEATTRAEAGVTVAPLLLVEAGTPQGQHLDEGRPIRPRLQLANLGNAEVLVSVRPGPGLEGAPAPFRLPAGGRQEVDLQHPLDGPVEEPRTLTVSWEAVALRDGTPTGQPTGGEVVFQVMPGHAGEVSPRLYVAAVFGAGLLLIAAVVGLLLLLGRWADRRT